MFKKNLIQDSDEKKGLRNNILSLMILQGANYIFPLLTVPYLVRVLGADYFGLLAFATATITYFILITDYGFNLSATRQIAINRNNKIEIDQIFSSVIIIKSILMIISLCLLTILILYFEKFKENWEVYYMTFGMLIGQTLFPIWLYQGLEKMKYITYLNISSKIFFTILIFIFVKEKSDYLLVPFFTSLGFILAGIWSLIIAIKKFKIIFKWQSISNLKLQLIDGWHVFFSSISISLYTISATFILGILTNNNTVGQFAAADKIIQALKGLYSPISQSIYPLVGKKIAENKKEGLRFIYKTTWFVGIGMFIFSLGIYLFAEQIVFVLLGDTFHQSIILLKIMAFLPFVIVLSNMFGIQTMLNLGYKKAFSNILVLAAILGISLSLIFISTFKAKATAIIMLFVEIFVTISMWLYLRKKLKIQ